MLTSSKTTQDKRSNAHGTSPTYDYITSRPAVFHPPNNINKAAFFCSNHEQRKFQTSVKNLPLCPEGRALEHGEDYCYLANKLLSLRGRTLPGLKTEVWTRYTRPHKLGPPFSIARKSPARRRTAHPTRVYPSIQIGLSTSRQPTGHGLAEATL